MAFFSLGIMAIGALVIASLFNPQYMQSQDMGVACNQVPDNPCGRIGANATLGFGTTDTVGNCLVNTIATNIFLGGFLAAYNALLALWNVLVTHSNVQPCATVGNTFFAFNPYDQTSGFFFVGLLTSIIVIGTIGGVHILTNGLSSASVFILTIGAGLILLWASLSVNALPTFLSVPFGIGGTMYVIASLSYTIFGLSVLGSVSTSSAD